jgi:hypothetical protein
MDPGTEEIRTDPEKRVFSDGKTPKYNWRFRIE